jgi:hypothetical protein
MLEYFTSVNLKTEAYFCSIDGRMGFDQETGGAGTLNDFQLDLGLPADQRSVRVSASVRPLEHHLLRLFGSTPENYKGRRVLSRGLTTRNGAYAAGTEIESTMSYAAFGFGYDLDFLVGPQYQAGLHGELRYLHARAGLAAPAAVGQEDVIIVDELAPCLGAHVDLRLPRHGLGCPAWVIPRGFARMTYSMTPNYLNYVDINIGIGADLGGPFGRGVGVSIGYGHESFFWEQELVSGKVLNFKRNGLTFSIEGTF